MGTTACGSSRRSLPSQSGRSGEANRKELVMGQVKILKRGEVLSPKKSVTDSDPDLVIGSTERLGPDPSTVQKQIKAAEFKLMDAIYAGSGAYHASPPPRSVPLPAFLAKNVAATSDLCRLLRLHLV